MTDTSKLVIADGQEIVREAIAARVEQEDEITVVAEASDGYSAIKACRQHNANILLMDLSLTRPSGTETLAKIRKTHPDTRVVILSTEANLANAFMVLSQGAVGFLPKQSRGADFVSAVKAASNGFAYLPTDLLKDFVISRRNISRSGNVYGLSARELEILEASITGQSAKEVGTHLNISVRTVETHRNSIRRKTACKDYRELAHLLN